VPAVMKCLERAEFDTGFTYSQFKSSMVSHGVYGFANETTNGKAVYVHEMVFEQLTRLNKLDTAQRDDHVAMRDVDYTMTTNLGNGSMTADVDLDEEPL